MTPPRHPAKYSQPILELFSRELPNDRLKVYDPFGGVGTLHTWAVIHKPKWHTFSTELEYDWACQCPIHVGTVVGDALNPPFPFGTFDLILTSVCYGNRMADHHDAKDDSKRNTYKHALGHDPRPESAAVMQWGPAYRDFHRRWLANARCLMKDDGLLVLNVSDHIRKGKVQEVSQWFRESAENPFVGLQLVRHWKVPTRRFREGANADLRVDHENVYIFAIAKSQKSIDLPSLTRYSDPAEPTDHEVHPTQGAKQMSDPQYGVPEVVEPEAQPTEPGDTLVEEAPVTEPEAQPDGDGDSGDGGDKIAPPVVDEPEAEAPVVEKRKRAVNPRGWLSDAVKKICDRYVTGDTAVTHKGDKAVPLTPHRVSLLVKDAEGLDKPPSTGAVAAVFQRWDEYGFATFNSKEKNDQPYSFDDYTDLGRNVGLKGILETRATARHAETKAKQDAAKAEKAAAKEAAKASKADEAAAAAAAVATVEDGALV